MTKKRNKDRRRQIHITMPVDNYKPGTHLQWSKRKCGIRQNSRLP
jgi:hypothetical protein